MSDATIPKKTATMKKVTVDVRVEAEPPHAVGRYYWHLHRKDGSQAGELEYRIEELEQWAKEFMAFVRDHRSRDLDGLHVVRVTEDQCSCCGDRWEPTKDEETGALVCAACGVEVAS